ncbi:MAG: YicC family protein [Nitrospinota bacterium]|nr:YicC family protein [Nitrospinota bacterium]
MLNSMTGYGRSEKQNGVFACKAEVRSVNNRFIEINTRLPKFLSALELPIKKLIKSRCARGSFDLFLILEKNDDSGGDLEIKPNLGLATQYFDAFQQIKNELGLAGDIQIDALLGMKDIIKTEPLTLDESQEKMVLETVEEALTALIEMRREEGNNLQKDLAERLQGIHQLTRIIHERQPLVLEEYRNRLNEKIKTLTEGMELDENRMAQETALLADRCDISEEITRLGSHLEQFSDLLKKPGPIGRKMEFITQEINRETNTIGSKSADFQISQNVIEIKSLLEKIREQLANIE